ncbi:hypothetical protein [Streptococcus gwangjuensis]|uniref:hypothetical protein n=1 Tax=Streptococcus gwangjuensis TaxID=1433513 RepID=UPI002305DB71|nr:hypothetical protein [Streptococcus gwangjuense]MDB0074245.1 hypothetical protein [Streptococcus gwangjuense]
MEIKKKIIQYFLFYALAILGYLFGFLSILNLNFDSNSTIFIAFASFVLLLTNTDIYKLILNYKKVEIFDELNIKKYINTLKWVYLYSTFYGSIIKSVNEINLFYTNLSFENIITNLELFSLTVMLPFVMLLLIIGIIKRINYLIMSKEHKIRMFIKTLLLGTRIELRNIVVREDYGYILKNAEQDLRKKLNIDSIHLAPVSNQDISIYSINTDSYILTVQTKYIDTIEEESLTIESLLLKIQIDFENNRINHVKFFN